MARGSPKGRGARPEKGAEDAELVRPTGAIPLRDYLHWTRDVSVSWAYLLPLLALYEIGVLWSGSSFRNAAELIFKGALGSLPGWAVWLQHLTFLVVLVLAIDLIRRDVPALRLYPLFLLEATLLALLMGPVVGTVVGSVGLRPAGDVPLAQQLLLSLGAGIYEEIVFRFLVLAGLFTFLNRAAHCDRVISFAMALFFSASLFSLYHHLGDGAEQLLLGPVLFRFVAGILLGLLLALRGLAMCVYLHAFFDILCDLRQL